MRYQGINRYASRTVSVPMLSGGVNLEDPLNLTGDNQMTDSLNLWYKNGAVRTRPALRVADRISAGSLFGESYSYISDFFFMRNNKKYRLVVTEGYGTESLNDSNPWLIYVHAISADDVLFSAMTWYSVGEEFDPGKDRSPLVFFEGKSKHPAGLGIFMIVNGAIRELVYHDSDEFTEDFALRALQQYARESYTFDNLTSDEIYSPAIYLNGKGNKYSEMPTDEKATYAAASLFEGYNMAANAWQSFYFVTDGVSDSFTLPYNEQYIKKFKAELTISDTEKYTFTDKEGDGSITPGSDKTFTCEEDSTLTLVCEKGRNTFSFRKNGEVFAPESRLGILSNNLAFKIILPQSENKLGGMSIATWFGGAADGISGGTRLFLSGHRTQKNLLIWTDLNEPTYFPENNYSYVGNAQSAITALQKQSNMLVIFKENELYYTVYSEGESYTQEDVTSGNIVDVTTMDAIFPLIHIHSEIGCDLPKTIQLCNDRLVWMCKDRNVYTLKGASQYSTANIAPMSKMCRRALVELTEDELSFANSVVYDGYYLLTFRTKIFALDYDSYYFKNAPSYSDSRKIQSVQAWYIWELPNPDYRMTCQAFISYGNKCGAVQVFEIKKQLDEGILVEWTFVKTMEFSDDDANGYTDNVYEVELPESGVYPPILTPKDKPVTSIMQTKMFDFGAPDRFKKIEQLYIGLGETAGTTNVTYLTESGTLDGGSFEIVGEGDDYSPEYIKLHRFLPGIMRVLRFGVRLKCEGRIAISGVTIKFKPMGVTR